LASELRIPQRHDITENRFCTWPAGIALPRGGDAY